MGQRRFVLSPSVAGEEQWKVVVAGVVGVERRRPLDELHAPLPTAGEGDTPAEVGHLGVVRVEGNGALSFDEKGLEIVAMEVGPRQRIVGHLMGRSELHRSGQPKGHAREDRVFG